MPKRMRRAALLGALAAKVETLKVVDVLGIEAPKTQVITKMCVALSAGKRVLVVAPTVDSALVKSAANIPYLMVLRADSLNLVDLINADTIIVEQSALATRNLEREIGRLIEGAKAGHAAGIQVGHRVSDPLHLVLDGDHHVGGFERGGRIQALAHPGRSAGAVNGLCDVERAVGGDCR